MKKDLYPLLFEPVLKSYIWGGRKLEELGRDLPPDKDIAESWEIAGHDDGTTKVINGRFAGQSLTELLAALKLDLIGENNRWALERDKFPLLIKLLDANRPLSVQVHPQDDYALKHEGNELGKTEMWVVLAAQPGAELILGVKQGTSAEKFEQAIADDNLESLLHHLAVKAGDHVCVPAGTLHAIMEGLLIAEIQQNSNTTYRVYDWNRTGADGKPRPLHVQKALDVIDFDQQQPQIETPQIVEETSNIRREVLCANKYFTTERLTLAKSAQFEGNCDGQTLEIWGVLQGIVGLNSLPLNSVRFTLLPASMGPYTVKAEKTSVLLRTYVAKNG